MPGRRVLILVAVLLGSTAVGASIAQRDLGSSPTPSAREPGGARVEPQLEPQAGEGTVTTAQDVPDEPRLNTLDARRSGQKVQVQAGRRVRLAIRSPRLGSVQVGDGGPVEPIDPDAPARFDLLYETPMRLAIRVRDADGAPARTIGRLVVAPAPR